MKKYVPLLWLLTVPTVINMPDDAMVAIVPLGCYADASSTTLVCPPIAACPPSVPVVSSGPVIMRARETSDCTQIEWVNPNSSCGPTKWVACP